MAEPEAEGADRAYQIMYDAFNTVSSKAFENLVTSSPDAFCQSLAETIQLKHIDPVLAAQKPPVQTWGINKKEAKLKKLFEFVHFKLQ